MYHETVTHFTRVAEHKLRLLQRSPLAFFVSAMMAGAYVGIGIVLIFVLGSTVGPELRKLVMGATFGIALTLVVIAGAELFTGHNMYMVLARMAGRVTLTEMAIVWAMAWLGNLAGSALLAALVAVGGGSGLLGPPDGLLQQVASYKMNSPPVELFARAVLCNWLVCLALWMAARVQGDTARCIVIWWCLFAFIACGFEHSVANMTLLTLAMLGPHGAAVSFAGLGHNLLWVSLGNIVGGALFVGAGYWVVSRGAAEQKEASA